MHGKVGCKKKTISANASTLQGQIYMPPSGTTYLLENDVTCPFLFSELVRADKKSPQTAENIAQGNCNARYLAPTESAAG